jgi:CBS-domain-containing membrane protein
MSREVYKVSEGDDLKEARNEMCKHQVRRLIVLDDQDQICGVVSLGDIATKCRDPQIDAKIIEIVSEKTH